MDAVVPEASGTDVRPSKRSRRAGRLASGDSIREAAARLFLEHGYQGTSMDEVAAAAQVSKQTIYTHFANKEELFTDLVLGNAARVDRFVDSLAATVEAHVDLEDALRDLARRYIRLVIRPEVLQLRRLVLGEVGRFPRLARTYYDRVPGRVIDALTALFSDLAAQGRLSVDDPALAAQHFAWLVLGEPLDRGMFYAREERARDEDLDRLADAATAVFFAAYGPRRPRTV